MGDTLFGGGGGDVPSNRKLQNLDITPSQYKSLRDNYGSLYKSIFGGNQSALNTSLGSIPDYSGSYTAGMTSQEQSLIDQLFGNSLRGQSQGLLGDTISGKYLSPDSNPYLKQTADAALGDLKYQWENYTMPQLRSQFTGAGQTLGAGTYGSSPFDRAAALAGNEMTRQSADILTNIYGQNYQQERDRQMGAVPLQQQNTQELINTLQAVALPRLIEQYGIDQGVQEFRNRLNTLMQALGMGGQLSQVQQAGYGGGQQQQGQFGEILGGIGSLAGAAALAFSDRRLKADILPLRVTLHGAPLYEFRYLWDRPGLRRWGVMAQEAPRRAVRRVGLWLAVDYSMLGA